MERGFVQHQQGQWPCRGRRGVKGFIRMSSLPRYWEDPIWHHQSMKNIQMYENIQARIQPEVSFLSLSLSLFNLYRSCSSWRTELCVWSFILQGLCSHLLWLSNILTSDRKPGCPQSKTGQSNLHEWVNELRISPWLLKQKCPVSVKQQHSVSELWILTR